MGLKEERDQALFDLGQAAVHRALMNARIAQAEKLVQDAMALVLTVLREECACRTSGCGHPASEHDAHGGCKLCQRLNCWS